MAQRDFYEVLGIKRTATDDEIRRAYRNLARKYHPDVNKSEDAQAKFTEVQEAYDVLSDPEKRRIYDRLGHAGLGGEGAAAGGSPRGSVRYTWSNVGAPGGGSGGASPFDHEDLGSIFDAFFRGHPGGTGGFGGQPGGGPGRARAASAPGADLHHTIDVDFLTAARGGTQKIRVARGGSTRTIDVTIPRATADGAKLRIKGEGQPSASGGRPGDLILTVRVRPHPLFRREDAGPDLTIDLPLTIAEATLGARVQLPTLDGPVGLAVPPGTSSGAKLRLKGRGLEAAGGRRGDLYAVARIVAPKASEIDDNLKAALEAYGSRAPSPRTGPGWITS